MPIDVDNLIPNLLVAGGFALLLLLVKAVWGRTILKKAMSVKPEKTFKVYINQALIRFILLLVATVAIIYSGYVDVVLFLVIFIGGYFFVQIYEIKYLNSLNKIV